MADPLFTVKNVFHLGAYDMCIEEADDLDLTEAQKTERDFYVYRSHLALGHGDKVQSEIADSAPMALQGVKLLAVYKASAPGTAGRSAAVHTVRDWMNDSAISNNPLLRVMAGVILSEEGEYLEALKICATNPTLETMAICVQIYLRMDRPDLAEKMAGDMMHLDEDCAISQLCNAWACIAIGGSKLMDAFYTFQELAEKYTWTATLYTACAVAHMKMGQYEEAEREITEALTKSPTDPDALANAVVVSQHLGRPAAAKFLQQLQSASPGHVMLQRVQQAEANFDACLEAASY